MPTPGVPTPWNNWLGWSTATKPYMVYPNVYAAAAYVNSFLYFLVGQPTTAGGVTYDGNTFWGVVNFQRFWGLTVDGEAGPQTLGTMDWLA